MREIPVRNTTLLRPAVRAVVRFLPVFINVKSTHCYTRAAMFAMTARKRKRETPTKFRGIHKGVHMELRDVKMSRTIEKIMRVCRCKCRWAKSAVERGERREERREREREREREGRRQDWAARLG